MDTEPFADTPAVPTDLEPSTRDSRVSRDSCPSPVISPPAGNSFPKQIQIYSAYRLP